MTLYARTHTSCARVPLQMYIDTISDTDCLQSMFVDHYKHLRQVNDPSMH